MAAVRPKLLLGVGNVLRRDEGVGVRVADLFARLPLPPDVEVCDGGTLGLDAATLLEGRRLVVVVDAVDANASLGEIFRLQPEDLVPATRCGFSVHDFHLLDALEQTRLVGTEPERVVVLAVQVQDVSVGIGLTPAVEQALPKVARQVARELDLPESLVEQSSTLESSWSS